MRSIKPRDELEAMLATQMGAIHIATMMMARRLNHVQSLPQQDAAERALNKLARTFTTQMDALKRYRTGGQQKVTVEHVTVNAGGQAIVGAVTRGGGGVTMESSVNPMHPAQRLADAPRCTATSKTTGCRCKGPAVNGWNVCRMHGARGSAPFGPANGMWRHGERSVEAQRTRQDIQALVQIARGYASTLPD